MAEFINLGGSGPPLTEARCEAELRRLTEPGALQRRLQDIDKARSFRQIYILGCGRSGTWLLTHVIGTLSDVDVLREELEIAYFGLLTTQQSALAFKRNAGAYRTIKAIPETIEIAYVIRHPYDVLTSHLPGSGRPYHILADRWLGEMEALKHLVDTGRRNVKIIRYEDLVANPVETQSDLAKFFGLSIATPITELVTISNNPTEGPKHRYRKLDVSSINKHQHDVGKLSYLRNIRTSLGQMLEWVGSNYDYDISILEKAVG